MGAYDEVVQKSVPRVEVECARALGDARTPVKGLDYLEPEGEGHVWITVPRPSPSNDKLSSRVIERCIQGHRTS